jgi:hypothetical protein
MGKGRTLRSVALSLAERSRPAIPSGFETRRLTALLTTRGTARGMDRGKEKGRGKPGLERI